MHSADQLRLYSDLAKNDSLILHLDATGGLIRRGEYVKRQIFLYSAVIDSPDVETSCISISDCLMEQCRLQNVEIWLRHIRSDVAILQNVNMIHEKSAPIVVVSHFTKR